MDAAISMRRALVVGIVVGVVACHETTTEPTLSASCAANPSTGFAPLAVSFNLLVAGASGSPQVTVDYGDGTSGTNPDVIHSYGAIGIYTAAFTVTSGSQTARCATTVTVAASTVTTIPIVNRPPQAVFKTTPDAGPGDQITGTAPLVVRFNMCPTADPDGDRLLFTMDFDGDGRNEVSGSSGAACRHDSIPYGVGPHTAYICVTDIGADERPLHGFQCHTYRIVVS
jgi:PKD domain